MFKKFLAFVAAMSLFAAFAATDANKATVAELDGLKGIGPGISAKIVDERKKGDFKDWNDFISRVNGVGEKNAAKFSAEGMTIGGASFKGSTPSVKKDAKPATAAAKMDQKKTDSKPAAAAPVAAATTATTAPPMKADTKKPMGNEKAIAVKPAASATKN